MFEPIQIWLRDDLQLTLEAQDKLLSTLVTLLILWGLRYGLLRIVQRSDTSLKRRYYWRRISLNVVVVLMIINVARIWFHSFESLGTVIGLASAGLAIALKDPITDLAGWLFIIWRNPFDLGERIEIGVFRGDVVDRRAFQFSLMEVGGRVGGEARTGRVIHVPNAFVFNQALANYSRGWFKDLWLELPVVVTFESDWRAAKALLTDIAAKHGRARTKAVKKEVATHASEFLVLPEDLNPKVITRAVDHGVELTLRLLCPASELRITESLVWEDVLSAFSARKDVDLAYPTTRFYDNVSEGKPPASPPVESP